MKSIQRGDPTDNGGYAAGMHPEWVTSRMKLEVPCVYENDPNFGLDWFKKLKNEQVRILDNSLHKFNIERNECCEEHADEVDTVCQQKFFTLGYKISSYNFQRNLLSMTRTFFNDIEGQMCPPFMRPLLIFPSSEVFDSSLVCAIYNIMCGAFFWGNIQGGTFFNHWEISYDQISGRLPTRASDSLWVDFEFDRNDMIVCNFICNEEVKNDEERGNRTVVIKITKPSIRRIIVENNVSDHFGKGRTRIHFELNYPPRIESAKLRNMRFKGENKLMWDRKTTVKRGRKENEWPKDAELSGCPFFSIELSNKIDDSKIYTIISRLRMRTNLSIEFGSFAIVDALMKMDMPYFSWSTTRKFYHGSKLFVRKVHPTSDKCKIFRDFLNYCFPRNNRLPPTEQAEIRYRRFVMTFLIECLLSRGAVVKDQLCLHRWHWLRFLQLVAWQVHQNFDRAERTLERLITMIDGRKRLGSINKTLMQLYEVIKQEDTNPVAPTEDETREGYQRVRKVIVTPTRTIYVVPEMMMSNRVLRRYDPQGIKVLRVSFRDDDGQKMRNTKTGKFNIERSVKQRLVNGMFIAGIDFGYLGSSNSQLRDHGAYFMQKMDLSDVKEWRRLNNSAGSRTHPPRDQINQILYVRKTLGKFEKIESIPKLMARLGQCFTQSRESGVTLPLENCAYTYDIIGGQNSLLAEFIFTDGVGCVSLEFAKKMAQKFGIPKGTPSCFQIRYRGFKGVLVVNTLLDEHNQWVRKKDRGPPPLPLCASWEIHVALRSSQDKFYGARQDCIEIVKVSAPSPVNLNRPFINILDQVSAIQGAECHQRVTERIQELLDRQMRGFATQMIDEIACRNRLKELPRRIDIDKLSTSVGFEMSNEIFFRSLVKASIKFAVSKQLRKAQIQIPSEHGRTLLGVADETGRLQYGQVFVRVHSSIREKFPSPNASKKVLKGKVLITKNPCIVAGDVRIFEAVDIPELHHLVDVIVFPVHGPRPHPDEMAGSDLDGDEYCVIWDKQLFLNRNEKPFDFSVPKRVDEDVTQNIQEKMADFYVKYMTQDAVGTIANAFLTAADQYGINHKVCIQLAKKNNQAVDFTKSGQPPEPLEKNWTIDEETKEDIPPEKSERAPDFQNENEMKPMYQSARLLGKLYREIKGIEDVMSLAADKDEQSEIRLDPLLEVNNWENYIETTKEQLDKYNALLRTLMENYGIRTEAEIFSGCICEMRNRLSDKDADDMSFFNTNQVIETKVTNMFRRFREQFFEEFGGWQIVTEKGERQFADEMNVCHREVKNPTSSMKAKAYAYYRLCYERAESTKERFLSFAWLAYDVLASIKQSLITAGSGNVHFTITGNPLFQLLEDRVSKYIAENETKFKNFRAFHVGDSLPIAIETLIKYCYKYQGLDKLFFIVHEWANNLKLFTCRFTSTHLCLLVIMVFINAFGSLNGDALQLLEPIPICATINDLKSEQFGRISDLLVKFFEFLASRKFGTLQYLSFDVLGVQSVFCRGEWTRFHRAAITTYYNMVYNLRFDELPLETEKEEVKVEIIREMEPFTIELPDNHDIDDKEILVKLQKKTNVEQVSMRRLPRNKVMISARGTLEALDALHRLVIVMPPMNMALRGREFQEKIYNMVQQKIMKDEVVEFDLDDINESNEV